MSPDLRQAKSHADHILRFKVRMQIGCSPKAIPEMMADHGDNIFEGDNPVISCQHAIVVKSLAIQQSVSPRLAC